MVTSQPGHRTLDGDLELVPVTNMDGTSRTTDSTDWVAVGRNGGGRWNRRLTSCMGVLGVGVGSGPCMVMKETSCFRFVFRVTVVTLTESGRS